MFKQPAIAFDQFLNTLTYIPGDGFGMADESISARLFRCHLQDLISDVPYRVIDAVFFWQDSHCMQSWRAEWERAQQPTHYRS